MAGAMYAPKMRTLVVGASMQIVQRALAGLEGVRIARGPDGQVWAQSPVFDRMPASEIQNLVETGVAIAVWEDQDPFPDHWDELE